MYSLNNDIVVKNLTWRSVNFQEFLRITSIKEINANITKLKENLDNVTALAELDYVPIFLGLGLTRKTWTDFAGLFSFYTTILSIVVFYSHLLL